MTQKINEMLDCQLIDIIQNSNDGALVFEAEKEESRRSHERCEADFDKAEKEMLDTMENQY